MVKEEAWLPSPPQPSPLPVLLMLLFSFLALFVHVDSLDLLDCLAVHTDPARTLN